MLQINRNHDVLYYLDKEKDGTVKKRVECQGRYIYKLYRYVPHFRVWFSSCFSSEIGYGFCLFSLEWDYYRFIGTDFRGQVWKGV